jgi:hypothetical protein
MWVLTGGWPCDGPAVVVVGVMDGTHNWWVMTHVGGGLRMRVP